MRKFILAGLILVFLPQVVAASDLKVETSKYLIEYERYVGDYKYKFVVQNKRSNN